MVMVADLLPGLKRFLRGTHFKDAVLQMICRLVIAFLLHSGRMSCLQTAGAVRCGVRHRAQVGRMLKRASFRGLDFNRHLRDQLLQLECEPGMYVFLIDATLTTQAGSRTQNTFSVGNRWRTPQPKRKYNLLKTKRKRSHSFTMGLLITPSGIRIPFAIPFHTKEYCRAQGLVQRTTAEAAAEMIRALPLPEGAEVLVMGDTAYDAEVVQQACAARGYDWIFPCNPERVLAGAKPRPKVRSLLKDWPQVSRQTIKLYPGQGPLAVYRRLSPHRIGRKAKTRTYYVHQEKRDVHSVGMVRLVFSTMKKDLATATPADVKILMTNNLKFTARDVVERYTLRWQIELFFKELKSTLGFHQYRFADFAAVESWCEVVLLTFLYLEWHRAQQLRRRDLDAQEKRWWQHQRTYGLCQAVRLASQQNELTYLADRLETDGGIGKLKRLLRNALAPEYRGKL